MRDHNPLYIYIYKLGFSFFKKLYIALTQKIGGIMSIYIKHLFRFSKNWWERIYTDLGF